MIRPFSRPVRPLNANTAPDQIRGALNQLAKVLNGQNTTGVTSTGASTIYPSITGNAFGVVGGDDAAGNCFVDQIVWNPAGGTVTVLHSTTTDGAPAARTYALSSGALTLQMAAGTYTVVIVATVFTDTTV